MRHARVDHLARQLLRLPFRPLGVFLEVLRLFHQRLRDGDEAGSALAFVQLDQDPACREPHLFAHPFVARVVVLPLAFRGPAPDPLEIGCVQRFLPRLRDVLEQLDVHRHQVSRERERVLLDRSLPLLPRRRFRVHFLQGLRDRLRRLAVVDEVEPDAHLLLDARDLRLLPQDLHRVRQAREDGCDRQFPVVAQVQAFPDPPVRPVGVLDLVHHQDDCRALRQPEVSRAFELLGGVLHLDGRQYRVRESAQVPEDGLVALRLLRAQPAQVFFGLDVAGVRFDDERFQPEAAAPCDPRLEIEPRLVQQRRLAGAGRSRDQQDPPRVSGGVPAVLLQPLLLARQRDAFLQLPRDPSDLLLSPDEERAEPPTVLVAVRELLRFRSAVHALSLSVPGSATPYSSGPRSRRSLPLHRRRPGALERRPLRPSVLD